MLPAGLLPHLLPQRSNRDACTSSCKNALTASLTLRLKCSFSDPPLSYITFWHRWLLFHNNNSLADFAKYSIQQIALQAASVSSYLYYLMKGVNTGVWTPSPITALVIVPLVILVLVAVVAIKCTRWGPALWHKIQAFWELGWTRGRDKTSSDPQPDKAGV